MTCCIISICYIALDVRLSIHHVPLSRLFDIWVRLAIVLTGRTVTVKNRLVSWTSVARVRWLGIRGLTASDHVGKSVSALQWRYGLCAGKRAP